MFHPARRTARRDRPALDLDAVWVSPVNAYLAGCTVVDPGPDSEKAWAAMFDSLPATDRFLGMTVAVGHLGVLAEREDALL